MSNARQTIRQIPAAQITAGNNDRKRFDGPALDDLATSIKEHGLAQPITVRPQGDRFEIVAGERRFRAMTAVLGWTQVPCMVRDLDDEAASSVMLAENTGRADLNPMEEADAYHERIARFGWTPERLATVAGVSPDRVRRRLLLLALFEDARTLVRQGSLPLGHAELLAPLDHNRQMIALRVFRDAASMPLATFRQLTAELSAQQGQDGLFDLETFWREAAVAASYTAVRGKKAVTGAPTRSDLPAITTSGKDTTATIMDRFIKDLIDAGHAEEAATVGTLYTTLVHANFLRVPPESRLTS
jgi:ParB/RepB/Spo0J family partition protein